MADSTRIIVHPDHSAAAEVPPACREFRQVRGGRRHLGRRPDDRFRSRPVRTLLVLALALLLLDLPATLGTAQAAHAPSPRVGLPRGAERLSPFLSQVSCDPTAKPGVRAFRSLMLGTYRRGYDGGIGRPCSRGGTSEHKEGRAWDWMLDSRDGRDGAVATAAMRWLLAPGPRGEPAWNARRFGLMYVIWNGRIWRAYGNPRAWSRYSGYSPHTDHIHFSFGWAGAMGRTSWWSGRVARTDYGPCVAVRGRPAPAYSRPRRTPCPTPAAATTGPSSGASRPAPRPPSLRRWYGTRLAYGSRGEAVEVLQRVLRVRPVSGWYGPVTRSAVATWQRAARLPATGKVDRRTWARMDLAIQRAAARAEIRRYAGQQLSYGSSGEAVRVVQRALRVRPVSGWYGPVTRAAVRAYQRSKGLPTTGIVGPRTWRALSR